MESIYVLAFTAALIALLVTPLIKKLAFYLKVIDIPKGKRKIHSRPTPLLGGLSIYIAFTAALVLKKGSLTSGELGILAGATVIVIGGFLDDKYDIRPWQKLLFQIFGALCLLLSGVQITMITNPLGDVHPFVNIGFFTIPFTILWIVGITNALNLIDGLDGLAAGVSLISSITILVIALLNGRAEAVVLTAILSGAILGFLPYNFNPASIFMGDTGAQLLGFLLASISIRGAIKSAAAFAIAVPILAIGLPIYDTIFAMIRRKVNGKPIMQADRGHLHHRLLDMGLTQRQAVIIMYLISAVLGAISIIAMQISNTRSYFLLAAVISIFVFVAWRLGFFKHQE